MENYSVAGCPLVPVQHVALAGRTPVLHSGGAEAWSSRGGSPSWRMSLASCWAGHLVPLWSLPLTPVSSAPRPFSLSVFLSWCQFLWCWGLHTKAFTEQAFPWGLLGRSGSRLGGRGFSFPEGGRTQILESLCRPTVGGGWSPCRTSVGMGGQTPFLSHISPQAST